MKSNSEIKSPWFVYIIECSDGSYYTGMTKNTEERLDAHNSGKGAEYTKYRRPCKIVFQQEVGYKRNEALKLEAKIKKLSRFIKIRLIQGIIKI